MWTYSIATVYNFYSLTVKKQSRDLSKLAGILQLTGYTARSLDDKGNRSVTKTWKEVFASLNKMATMPISNEHKNLTNIVSAKNMKKLQEAKEKPKFMREENKQELRPVIAETGNAVANVFMKVGSPVVF